jgi:hypothetical protein
MDGREGLIYVPIHQLHCIQLQRDMTLFNDKISGRRGGVGGHLPRSCSQPQDRAGPNTKQPEG